MKCVGLIDCNNFFVSCERLFRPDLIQKPVVVLSSNDGCVVARSQEIKDKGIPMGVPYFQVKDILSDMGAAVFSSNFTLYRDISRRVFSVVRREIGDIEQYSIDECFFVVKSGCVYEVAERVRSVVAKEVGIPVSIGVGLSKTQAKFAAVQAKKRGGVCVFEGQTMRGDFEATRLTEIWSVGRGRSAAFLKKNLVTVGDYLKNDQRRLHEWFGVEGVRLLDELRGAVNSPLLSDPKPAKSHTSSRSFGEVCTDKSGLNTALTGHLEELVGKLHRENTQAVALRVMFYPGRYSDHILHGVSVELSLPVPTSNLFWLTKLVNETVETYFRPDTPYKKAGITLVTADKEAVNKPLFESSNRKTDELSTVITALNERLGRRMVRVGVTKDPVKAAWLPRHARTSPRYTTEWTSLQKVIAKDTCS